MDVCNLYYKHSNLLNVIQKKKEKKKHLLGRTSIVFIERMMTALGYLPGKKKKEKSYEKNQHTVRKNWKKPKSIFLLYCMLRWKCIMGHLPS